MKNKYLIIKCALVFSAFIGLNIYPAFKLLHSRQVSGCDYNDISYQSESFGIRLVYNPYINVNFRDWNHYKANMHTHTTESDGARDPDEVIYDYSNANYSLLAITDHSRVTWPWTDYISEKPDIINYNEEGDETSAFFSDLSHTGILAVRGNEFSSGHHRGSFFNNLGGSQEISDIEDKGGLAMFFHPGRYSNTIEWYNDFFDNYRETVLGMEVYNQGNRYSGDRAIWDSVNREREYNDLVWGFSNDDAHRQSHYFRNYQHFIAEELSEESIKNAMKNGHFYFSYEPDGADSQSANYGVASAPRLKNVAASENIIEIEGEDYDAIRWYNNKTEVIHSGKKFDVNGLRGNFVRAVLINEHGRTYLQPFGIYGSELIINLSARTLSEDEIKWSWNTVYEAQSYSLYCTCTSCTQELTGGITENSFIETGLSPNTAYSRYVTAYEGEGEIGSSNHSSAYTFQYPPEQPDFENNPELEPIIGETESTIKWEGIPGANYRVERNGEFRDNVKAPLYELSQTDMDKSGSIKISYRDTNLNPATDYTYSIYSLNDIGEYDREAGVHINLSTRVGEGSRPHRRFISPSSGEVKFPANITTVTVIDARGRQVAKLEPSGQGFVVWRPGKNIESGIYVYSAVSLQGDTSYGSIAVVE
ncbi:MAG: hypothetical protein ACQESB_00540 [Elusimicrobiota bacterium]